LLVAGLALAALPAAPALADTVGATDTATTPDVICHYPATPLFNNLLFADTNYVVPAPGTITSFSFFSTAANAGQMLDLQVLRADPTSAGDYMVVGKTGVETLAGTGLETFPPAPAALSIPVQAGDILGYWVNSTLDNCFQGASAGVIASPFNRTLGGPGAPDLAVGGGSTALSTPPGGALGDLNVSANFTPSPADLSITNTATTSVMSGKPLTYTIVASNTGGQPATGVTVTDQLPAGVRFVSATSTPGSCALQKKPAAVMCTVGTLAPAGSSGSSATITLVVTPTAVGPLSDTGTVTATNVVSPDPGGDDSATAPTTVTKKK
jgi:uncharacterized repeat protein (TIGR01451 family)